MKNPYCKLLARPLCVAVMCVCSSVFGAEDLPFNLKKVPTSKEDLLSIQNSLADVVSDARAATIGVKLGQGFGSAVIISPEGLILTAAHVSGGVEKELTVVMNDGSEYKAVTMGLLSETDAAMMRIVEKHKDGKPFPYVEVNKENDYKIGHWVFALGHSGGFDQERGPVLRLGRIVQDKPTTLQSDCKVIGGDSGGPLFDMKGRLIAIHSRVGRETVVENMHVPMREYLSHWKQLEASEFVGNGPFAKRAVKGAGFLGLGTKDSESGLLAEKVGEGHAAEKAGVKSGDVILEMGGAKIADKAAMKEFLAEKVEGDAFDMKILRDGKEMTLKVKLGKR